MYIDIKAHNSDVHPRWQAMVQRRAAKLTDFCRHLVRLQVTLVHSTHHIRGHEETRLLATIPNHTLRVQKAKASMGDAIHAAFSALERELQVLMERRKTRAKAEASRRRPRGPGEPPLLASR